MSSVQRFLRQRQTGQTLVLGPDPSIATSFSYFVLNTAGTSNYVGNYPSGVMVDFTTQLVALMAAQNPAMTGTPLLRDMGKTIKASLVPTVSTIPTTLGFFRAVQVLNPSSGTSLNSGVIGSPGGGLPSGNSGDNGYATYYIPIVVGGVVASAADGTTPLTVSAAGFTLGEQL